MLFPFMRGIGEESIRKGAQSTHFHNVSSLSRSLIKVRFLFIHPVRSLLLALEISYLFKVHLSLDLSTKSPSLPPRSLPVLPPQHIHKRSDHYFTLATGAYQPTSKSVVHFLVYLIIAAVSQSHWQDPASVLDSNPQSSNNPLSDSSLSPISHWALTSTPTWCSVTIYQLQIIPTSLTISSAFAYRGLLVGRAHSDAAKLSTSSFGLAEHAGTIPLGKNPYLDPAAQAFLEEFRFGSSSVRDVSAELDHRVKVLKATGGFSSVYATDGPHQVPRPFECVTKNYGHFPAHLTREVRIWKELWHPNILEFIGYAIAGERSDMKAILVSKWCANGNVVQYLRAHPNSSRTDLGRIRGRGGPGVASGAKDLTGGGSGVRTGGPDVGQRSLAT
ncbi:uncharacterized protein EI90DRAFT_3129226 [Cantharellus anzutake]|uniref:uncharacterized protein n=1 Tax=Cantharellus anzutake TaxID=1750568 RepID=UPI001907BBF6|nr:uncharacterized protein EI90DRAFT_3129226 [Cantharellus anzutake]KAF8325098.1 hypothetical protein EI90DRAFT_3129226 [Cantharellus anzutake]